MCIKSNAILNYTPNLINVEMVRGAGGEMRMRFRASHAHLSLGNFHLRAIEGSTEHIRRGNESSSIYFLILNNGMLSDMRYELKRPRLTSVLLNSQFFN